MSAFLGTCFPSRHWPRHTLVVTLAIFAYDFLLRAYIGVLGWGFGLVGDIYDGVLGSHIVDSSDGMWVFARRFLQYTILCRSIASLCTVTTP